MFQFRLKACSHAEIELRTSLDAERLTPPTYKLVIGLPDLSEQNDVIFNRLEIFYLTERGDFINHTFTIANLLSCNEYLQFWLSWSNNEIQIGRNLLYRNILATVRDPVLNRVLSVLHVGSADPRFTQEWEFSVTAGN